MHQQKSLPLLAYHATFAQFDLKDMHPLTHFGTLEAARQRADFVHNGGPQKSRMICAYVHMQKPLEVKDSYLDHKPSDIALSAMTADPFVIGPEFYAEIVKIEKNEPLRAAGLVSARILEAGYDGLTYKNLSEDEGSMGWIILDPRQLVVAYDKPSAEVHHPHEMSFIDFMKPHAVMDVFEIDGESEDYDHIWDALKEGPNEFPIIDLIPGGWSVKWLFDWEPAGTVALFDYKNEPQGFYMGGQCWLNEEARGHGLSAAMIEAAAILQGGSPVPYEEGMGFSEAGYAAHYSFWRNERAYHGKDTDPEPELNDSPSLMFG